MLALIKDNVLHMQVTEGKGFNLPDGSRVSPAYAGWTGAGGFKLLPVVEETKGTPTTSDIAYSGWVETIEAGRVVRSRTVRDLTEQEITDAIEGKTDQIVARLTVDRSIDKTFAKAIHILLNRVEALEGKPTPTPWGAFVTWFRDQIG